MRPKLNKIAFILGSVIAGVLLSATAAFAISILPVQQGGTGWGYPGNIKLGAVLFGGDNVQLATSTNLTFATTTNTLTTSNLKISGITGSIQCLHVDTSGNVTGTASDCGTGSGGVTSLTATYPLAASAATGAVTLTTAFGTTTNTGIGANLFIYTNNNGVFVGVASSSLHLPNAALTNSSITINTVPVSLGGSIVVASTTLLGDSSTFGGNDTFTNTITGAISGNAGTATKLATGRTIAITGDLSYTSPTFDGSGNVTAAGTLATVNTNVGTFTYPSVTVNGKGLITAISNGTAPTTYTATFPAIVTGSVISSGFSTTTNSGMAQGFQYVGSGGIFQTAASSSFFGFTPQPAGTYVTAVNGTANQITSSGGTSPTLSLPNHVIFPTDYVAISGSTTNATSTNFAIVGAASNCNGTSALTTNSTGVVGCTAQPQGTVTTVAVASSNGFAGSSSGGATPSLTLSTTITGLLKGNGTAISAATPGTDYDVFAYPFPANATTSSLSLGGLTIPGTSDGCATFASGVLGSTGSACGSGGGATFGKTFEIDALNWLTPTTSIGINAPVSGTTYGFGIGDQLLGYASSTNKATIFGLSAGGTNATTSASTRFETAIGYQALEDETTGSGNTALGYQAGQIITSGGTNTAIGETALAAVTSSIGNTAVGAGAMEFDNPAQSVAIGAGSDQSDTGSNNISIGYHAANTGQQSSDNVIIGKNAGLNSTGGSGQNVVIGSNAGGTIFTTGAQNTILGSFAGNNLTSGSGNVIIGATINAPSATAANTLDIQNILFGTSATLAGGAGQIGIGSSSPFARFSIQANNNDANTTLFAIGSSTASATTTLFSVSNTGSIFTTLSNGCVQAASGFLTSTGSSCGSGGGASFGWPFTPATDFAINTSATSTAIWAQNGIFASSTSVLINTTFASNGNVGIGTSSPVATLTVASVASADATPAFVIDGATGSFNADMQLNRGSNTGTEEANIDFATAGTVNYQLGIQNNSTSDFELWDGLNNPIFTIKNGTDAVGFGTTSPYGDFAINADYGDSTAVPIFNVASSSATATTSLFSITAPTANSDILDVQLLTGTNVLSVSSIGTTTLGLFGACSGTNALTTDSSGDIICGAISGTGGAAFPFTPGTFGASAANSTSTILVDYPGFVAATSTFGALTASSSITNQSVKSALVLNGSGGLEGAYGGASACATNNWVTTISATGGTTCGTIGSGGVSDAMLASTFVKTLTVSTANGISGSFTAGATPVLSLTLGALTGVTSLNGLVVTANTGVITTGTWNGTAIAIANGGTGAALTGANEVPFINAANTTMAVQSNFKYINNNGLMLGSVANSGSLFGTSTLLQMSTSTNTFAQMILQNTSNAGDASADLVVNNDKGTNTSYYGDFGINSSGYNNPQYAGENPGDVFLQSSDSGLNMEIASTSSTATPFNFSVFVGGTLAAMKRFVVSIASTTANTTFGIATTSTQAFTINDSLGTNDLLFNTASTTGSIFTVAATTSPSLFAPIKLFDVDQYGHLTASSTGATPTISCTPTNNPTIGANSNDVTGDVTTGTLSTACTVTFAHAYAATPEIMVTGGSTASIVGVTSRSTTSFTIGLGTAATGDDISYFVVMP